MQGARLKVTSGPLAEREFPLAGGPVTIGRSRESEIGGDGYEELSRQHARLAWDGNGWVVEDLQSRNGTMVDGQPVRRARLQDGSRLQLGDFTAQFLLAEEPAPAPEPAQERATGYTTKFRRLGDRHDRMQRQFRWALGGGMLGLAVLMLTLWRMPADPHVLPQGVASAVKDATVLIWYADTALNREGSGSGFVVDRRLVVTNRHVACTQDKDEETGELRSFVEHPCEVVFFSGTGREKKFLVQPDRIFAWGPPDPRDGGQVRQTDLAVLVLPEDAPVAPLALGDTESLHETETLYMFGFPRGVHMESGQGLVFNGPMPEPKVWPATSLMAHEVQRIVRRAGEIDYLQVGGDAIGGNSGGPLVNRNGDVMAVEQGGPVNTTINFTIPTRFVKLILEKVREEARGLG